MGLKRGKKKKNKKKNMESVEEQPAVLPDGLLDIRHCESEKSHESDISNSDNERSQSPSLEKTENKNSVQEEEVGDPPPQRAATLGPLKLSKSPEDLKKDLFKKMLPLPSGDAVEASIRSPSEVAPRNLLQVCVPVVEVSEGESPAKSVLAKMLQKSVLGDCSSPTAAAAKKLRRKKKISNKEDPLSNPNAKWDFDLRLPTSIGSMPCGDHFFEFSNDKGAWMLNVSVSELQVGLYLHTQKHSLLATCHFKVGKHVASLAEDGRCISQNVNDGWGVLFSMQSVKNVFKILITPIDLSNRFEKKEENLTANVWSKLLKGRADPDRPSSSRIGSRRGSRSANSKRSSLLSTKSGNPNRP